ncbi:hypothetical protein Tco_1144239 [Tanacetum coccineum]
MKVKESLNVTFDESPPLTKLSSLVDDDVGKEEAIKKNTKIVNNNNEEEYESIEVDEIANIKESKNHPLDQQSLCSSLKSFSSVKLVLAVLLSSSSTNWILPNTSSSGPFNMHKDLPKKFSGHFIILFHQELCN